MTSYRAFATGVVATLWLCGCDTARQIAGTLGDLQAVQKAVAAHVGTDNIRVNLNNGRYLTVGVVNTPLKTLPDAERRAKAREIAQVAYSSYSSKASLETVGVTFVVHRSYFLVFNYTDATDYFVFTPAELAEAGGAKGQALRHRLPPNNALKLTSAAGFGTALAA
jgi:hypothetical protein